MAASAPSRIFVTSLVLLHCVIVKADVISGQRDITRNVGLVQLAGVNDDVHAVDCGCSDPKYCRQNGWVPSTKVARNREVFGFVGGGTDFMEYDWNSVSTVAWGRDPALICKAHEHDARVVMSAPSFDLASVVIDDWVNTTVALVVKGGFDGVVFDYESPIAHNDTKAMDTYIKLVKTTTMTLHAVVTNSQTSVCVAWSPDDIDGRAYNAPGLADAADLLYVMVYDTQSQIFGRCIASANSPVGLAQRAIVRYTDLGIDPSKLILGLPWYGYNYMCDTTMKMEDTYCPIAEVPFRGVNCSDAAGHEVGYAGIIDILNSPNATKRRWDDSTQSPYFNYRDGAGRIHQVWYDDAESLAIKYALATKAGLRGTGPYTFDDLAYETSAQRKDSAAMWAALSVHTL
eukprot:m.62432 g.62432  ORF g.62432 m.62432 type:complete len:401 (-) comp23154_c1_seq3:152-1354(-)